MMLSHSLYIYHHCHKELVTNLSYSPFCENEIEADIDEVLRFVELIKTYGTLFLTAYNITNQKYLCELKMFFYGQLL